MGLIATDGVEWVTATSPIIVAFVGGTVAYMIHRLEKRNDEQHATNSASLARIETKVDGVAERLDDHIDWHLSATREQEATK